jgi:hypothetical protein
MCLNLDRERMELERVRSQKLNAREVQHVELMSGQNELKRQQSRDNTMIQINMMSVMEGMLRKVDS